MVAFAGQDTVSTTLSMFLNDMACYPNVQDRLRQEIIDKQVDIGDDGADFTQEDYESMPYLNAVLKVRLIFLCKLHCLRLTSRNRCD